MPRHASNMKHFEGNIAKDSGSPRSVAPMPTRASPIAKPAQMAPMPSMMPMPAMKKAKGR